MTFISLKIFLSPPPDGAGGDILQERQYALLRVQNLFEYGEYLWLAKQDNIRRDGFVLS